MTQVSLADDIQQLARDNTTWNKMKKKKKNRFMRNKTLLLIYVGAYIFYDAYKFLYLLRIQI